MSRGVFNYIVIGMFICVFIAVCGCASNSTVSSPAAIDAANAAADRVLSSINSGSYSEYSMNFSDAMIAQVNESQFNYTRSAVQDMFGNYVSRSGPTSSVIQGYDVFIYNCTFTKGYVNFQLTMNINDPYKVEGVFFRKP
jgi:hypothetical protein